MRRLVRLAFVALAACAAFRPPLEFRPYRACVIDDRGYFDPGTVVGEELIEQERTYLFVSDSNPNDGRHVQRVARVKRGCLPAQGRTVSAERATPGLEEPPRR